MLTNNDISKIKRYILAEIDIMQSSADIWADSFRMKHPGKEVDSLEENDICDTSKAMYEWASGHLGAYKDILELIESYERANQKEDTK